MNNSVQIAADLLSALLTGGFLLFFIETMHIESDVKQRFKSIMNPFYHKLSKMAIFVGQMKYSISFPKDNLGDELKKDMEFITRAGIVPMTSGRDIPYMNGDELDKLCTTFNNVWYRLDRTPALRKKLVIEYDGGLDSAAQALSDVYVKYKDKKIDIDTLYETTGSFYVDFWQPVEHCTSNYEYWESRSKATRILIFCALGITLMSLIILMIGAEYIRKEIPCILAILSSIIFIVCIGMMSHLITLSNKLFRSI